jgi:transcriptional regulator with XRE-family HTH domain
MIFKYFFVILMTRTHFYLMNNEEKLLKGIGKNLLKLREEKRMSQKELAESMDIAQTQYGKVERGEVIPSLPTLLKAATALGVDINKVVYGDTVKNQESSPFTNSIFFDRLKILDTLKGEDKAIAIQMIDLVVAKEKMKGIVKDIHTYHK